MGTITERKRKNGTTAYVAQIVITRERKPIHRENKTFDRRQTANSWIKKREKELNAPGGLTAAKPSKRKTLRDAIDQYVNDSETQMGRTKKRCYEVIKTYDIADQFCDEIGSRELLAFAQELKSSRKIKPQTVQNYMSHLGAVFRVAKLAWGMPLERSSVSEMFEVTKRLGVTNRADKRDRRPSLDELNRLMDHFYEQHIRYPAMMPMHKIIAFALFSTRRQEEITRLHAADLEEAAGRILVRDMKHPGQKAGNDTWCDLPPPTIDLLHTAPIEKGHFFPFNSKSISANFTRACHVLEIADLRFHDLRHEGISRLFEMGWNIPNVAKVSGHRSWSSLQRYAHINETGDKYENWEWIDRLSRI